MRGKHSQSDFRMTPPCGRDDKLPERTLAADRVKREFDAQKKRRELAKRKETAERQHLEKIAIAIAFAKLTSHNGDNCGNGNNGDGCNGGNCNSVIVNITDHMVGGVMKYIIKNLWYFQRRQSASITIPPTIGFSP